MWIQVRSMDGKRQTRLDGLSKLTKIEDLREKLVEHFEAEPARQMLFYRGKLMVDGHSLFDYNVGLNEIIQIMVRPAPPKASTSQPATTNGATEAATTTSDEEDSLSDKENKEPVIPVEKSKKKENGEDDEEVGSLYKKGDIIDGRDPSLGAWFEAKIKGIAKKEKEMETDENENKKDADDDGFLYSIVFGGYEEDKPLIVSSVHLRPRAHRKLGLDKIKIGDKLMVNYNIDDPDTRGYWYDGTVTAKENKRCSKSVTATIYIGKDLIPVKDCKLKFHNELFAIETAGSQVNENDPQAKEMDAAKRENKPECDHCKDNPRRKCVHCSCCKCGKKEDPELQLMCDDCDSAYHTYCLNPPLDALPEEDEWYCPDCKVDSSEVVRAGEKLKASSKKAKMASATSKSSRDWGKGMACAGRTKQCQIVPPNHFGPLPGIHVGSMWKFRVQVSEVGIHRPHVAGIHGREEEGAYSIVLSGGYEDDVDDGEQFTYTGSGGRDLSGNKRTAEQSCDQVLTRMNKALAKNCSAPIDSKKGGDSGKDWRKGKPVRVVRNCKGRKHSKYAPEEGNRYDGIYKVVKYWPEKGQSGFIVWRYLLKRDDTNPAPWTKEGKKLAEELGLKLQFPDGYLEGLKAKEALSSQDSSENETSSKGKGKGRKRKRIVSEDEEEEGASPAKKIIKAGYEIPKKVEKQILDDKANGKIWKEVLEFTKDGSQTFLAKVEENFACICCQDLAFMPVTTECGHNFCKTCLQRSFKAEVYSCPACREDLGKDYKMAANKTLRDILNTLVPGYENGR
ncbi:hypothetical protein CAPTEDRAFT_221977 [Capitella teleta]|uniref:RING-type E3 ubiquitin transferase n=1 Tax=Capitella teleta TaxID=283909 RepID=R7UPN0_CAPTE|nr:hypothetical protein CAPTEDRAFT_221977 [Capitella teleta]|eukprot:ELU05907.1 hypothetical protein CAPTEDRAFT_221977 [Capitella teleta]